MSRGPSEPKPETVLAGPLLAWAALLALLGLNVLLAFLPLGALKAPVNIGVGVLQALLIALVLMRLRRATPLVRTTAAAAALFLLFMFLMAGTDYLMRR